MSAGKHKAPKTGAGAGAKNKNSLGEWSSFSKNLKGVGASLSAKNLSKLGGAKGLKGLKRGPTQMQKARHALKMAKVQAAVQSKETHTTKGMKKLEKREV